jgi:hypothetical protein
MERAADGSVTLSCRAHKIPGWRGANQSVRIQVTPQSLDFIQGFLMIRFDELRLSP